MLYEEPTLQIIGISVHRGQIKPKRQKWIIPAFGGLIYWNPKAGMIIHVPKGKLAKDQAKSTRSIIL